MLDPAPFLRGAPFPSAGKAPYPRAKADDFMRLPVDTWTQAQLPVGVRLELAGDAEEIEIAYRCVSEEISWRGAGGAVFATWRGGAMVAEAKAEKGEGAVRLALGRDAGADRTGAGADRAIVYLPEWMKPEVLGIEAIDGTIEPAPPQPRWLCYGDSIVEGWVATQAALAWPAIAGREQALDVANLGYAGAARGEIVSAEHLATVPADVISISHGTNCWSRIPFDVALMREATRVFLDIVRAGHPETPIVVVSPILRPASETTPNYLGATLADLRGAMEAVVRERIAGGDSLVTLIPGRDLATKGMLADDVHPNDDGHRALATALGPAVRAALEARQ